MSTPQGSLVEEQFALNKCNPSTTSSLGCTTHNGSKMIATTRTQVEVYTPPIGKFQYGPKRGHVASVDRKLQESAVFGNRGFLKCAKLFYEMKKITMQLSNSSLGCFGLDV